MCSINLICWRSFQIQVLCLLYANSIHQSDILVATSAWTQFPTCFKSHAGPHHPSPTPALWVLPKNPTSLGSLWSTGVTQCLVGRPGTVWQMAPGVALMPCVEVGSSSHNHIMVFFGASCYFLGVYSSTFASPIFLINIFSLINWMDLLDTSQIWQKSTQVFYTKPSSHEHFFM